jgi:hypothetical protein
MIEKEKKKKIAENEKKGKPDGLQPKDFIGNVSAEKLREFIITQAKYNTELYNAVSLEFSSNAGNTKGNKYSKLIQKILASVDYDEYYNDDYYNEGDLNIDALDQWLDKARKCADSKQYGEVILICKAIIEEYSQWLYNVGEDVSRNFSVEYQSLPYSSEWVDEREKLFLRYSGKKHFGSSAANLLAAENEVERLLNYIEKYLSMNELERYYKVFTSDYPEKTLDLFKKVLVPYAANTGRDCYEHILSVLKKMSRIKGGKKAASDLAADFRIQYKNRRAMMEVLGGF